MLISIVIPCFNEAATLRTILLKVKNVSFGDHQREIILVDDGSTDGTREIIQSLTDPKIKKVFKDMVYVQVFVLPRVILFSSKMPI